MRKRINVILTIIIVACIINLVLDVLIIYANNQTISRYEQVVNEYYPHSEDLYTLSDNLHKMHSLTFSLIVTPEEEEAQKKEEEIERVDKTIQSALTSYAAYSQDKDEQLLLQRLYSSYTNYRSQQETAIALSKSSVKRSLEYINTTMKLKIDTINETLSEINDIVEKNVAQNQEELLHAQTLSNALTVSALLSLIILGTIVIIILRKDATRLLHFVYDELKNREHKIIHMQSRTIEGMAGLVESRDGETGEHVRNTALYVELIAQKLAEDSPYKKEMTPEYISLLKRYAPLHDVGKIVISDTILLKPARLTTDEFELMKQHTLEGGTIIDNILADIETPERIKIARDIAVHHHERWDGSGYPSHLAGQNIPLGARIMSVADVFDALISKRCYKDAFTLEDAYAIIRESDGTQFDPVVVKAFFSALPKIEAHIKNSQDKSAPAV